MNLDRFDPRGWTSGVTTVRASRRFIISVCTSGETHGKPAPVRRAYRGLAEHGAAGVRAGWLLGDPAWIAEIDKATTPYTVDAFSQVTATVLLGHADRLRERVEATLTERERLRAAVDGLPGYETEPSAGNFFLVHLAFRLGPPADLLAWLKARDIVLRDTSRHPLLEDTFRITVGRPDESDRIVAALAEYAER